MERVDEGVKQKIGGFFDGDGTVTLVRSTKRMKRPHPRVRFSQSYASGMPPELLYIQGVYGGRIYADKRCREGQRKCWELQIQDTANQRRILRDLRETCCMKLPQVELVLEYLGNGMENSDHYSDKLRSLKKEYHQVVVDPKRITWSYIAGSFAADGMVAINWTGATYDLRCTLCKPLCPQVLHSMREFLGYGNVTKEGYLTLASRQSTNFLRSIQPYLFGQKVDQLPLALRFQEVRPQAGVKRTAEQLSETVRLSDELKRLKRL